MIRVIRILLGLAIIGFLLAAASWAVRDCEVAPHVFENCIWLGARDALGLHQSKLVRAVVLQAMGISILAGMYLVWRYVFPRHTHASQYLSENNPRPH